MSDADFATIKKLQQERNAAAAAKKGSRTFDPASQRADSSSKAKMSDVFDAEDDVLAGEGERSNRITDRETDYQKRRFDRVLTPTRADPFAANRQAGASADEGESYRDIMERRELEREEERVRQAIEAKMKEGALDGDVVAHQATLKDGNNKENEDAGSTEAVAGRKRKKRWDVATTTTETTEAAAPQPE